jgi:hypothetical protein
MFRTCFAHLAALAAAAALSACAAQNSRVSNVDRIYTQMLNNRFAEYNQTAIELDAQLKAQLAPPEPATTPASAPAAVAPNPNLPNEIMNDAEVHARASILNRFMREAAASGQIGLMASWLQTQAQELQRYSQDTDAKVGTFQQAATKNPKDPQLGSQMVVLLMERGGERGAAEELMTLTTDLQGYERDYKGAATADEQRRQDTVRLLAAYLSAPRINVQAPTVVQAPIMTMPTFTSCQPFLSGMNCITH